MLRRRIPALARVSEFSQTLSWLQGINCTIYLRTDGFHGVTLWTPSGVAITFNRQLHVLFHDFLAMCWRSKKVQIRPIVPKKWQSPDLRKPHKRRQDSDYGCRRERIRHENSFRESLSVRPFDARPLLQRCRKSDHGSLHHATRRPSASNLLKILVASASDVFSCISKKSFSPLQMPPLHSVARGACFFSPSLSAATASGGQRGGWWLCPWS